METGTNTAVPANRLGRRKARTRQALIDAVVRLLAEGRGEHASIQEITEAADIGFGFFCTTTSRAKKNSSQLRPRKFSSAGHE